MAATKRVEVFPGRSLRLPIQGSVEGERVDDELFDIDLELDLTPEGVRPVSVCVRSSSLGDRPSTVRLTTLRAVKVAELAQTTVLHALFPPDEEGDWDQNPVLLERLIDSHELERVRGLGLCDESLRYAAYAYMLGRFLGFPPAQQVELGLELSRQSATRWVALARDREWVTPATAPPPVSLRRDFWDLF